MSFKNYIPILDWLPGYRKNQLKGDLSAGLTVGIMLIPQGMAYAMIAGLPPIYGLYASTIPLILYAIFGTSRQLAVGPVAMVALLVASGIGQIADPGSTEFIALAITLAFMVGTIQFVLGALRLGFIVNFLSHPVISGFTSAAALIIGFSQLKHLLGIDLPRSHHVHEILINAFENLGSVHLPTLILGLAGIGIIILVKRVKKSIPGPLVVVVLGILAVWLLGLDAQGMKIVGVVPDGLPPLSFPDLGLDTMGSLLPVALTISLISFMESIAVAKAIQRKHKDYEVSANQELIGLGLANIGTAFFSGFPVTGGFSRTAVNDQAGANTGLAGVFSAGLILLTLLLLTPLFHYLPNAILASIIMVAVFGLIDFKEAKHLWHSDKKDFAMLVITFVMTLALGVEIGIGTGVVLSLGMVIFQSSYPHIAVLGKMPGRADYLNIERFPQAVQQEDVLIVRFDAQLFFANTGYLKEKLAQFEAEKGEKLKVVILNAKAINSLDSSAVQTLRDIITQYQERGIRFMLTNPAGPIRDILVKSDLLKLIGMENVFICVEDAMLAFSGNKEIDGEKASTIVPDVLNPDEPVTNYFKLN